MTIGTRISALIPRVQALAVGPLVWAAARLPQFTSGEGAPSVDLPNGSLYLRTDAGSSDEAVYARVGGAWVTVAGATSAALEALAALTPAADRLPYFTGSTTASLTTLTSFARTLLDDINDTTARATLGAQQSNSNLTALAGQTWAADQITYQTGPAAVANTPLSSFMRTVLDDTTDTAARTTLGAAASADFGSLGKVTGSDITTTDNTTGVSTGLTMSVTSGKTYEITWALLVSTASLTNGWQHSVKLTGGATASVCFTTVIYQTTSAQETSSTITNDTWSAATTGPTVNSGGTNQPVLAIARTLIVCTGSGTLTLWMKPETSGSTARLSIGSGGLWRVI